MKKIMLGTVMAVCAMLSACENIALQESTIEGTVHEAAPGVVLTAAIGADTKTFLEEVGGVFKTRWAQGDELFIWDSEVDYSIVSEDIENYLSTAELWDGAGESTAEFWVNYGKLPNRYVAAYGNIRPAETGRWMAWIPRKQYGAVYKTVGGNSVKSFGEYTFPMVARGSGTSLQFHNICSVMKLSITGNGETLEKITISAPYGTYISGAARLDLNVSSPSLSFYPENEGNYDVKVYNDIIYYPTQWFFGDTNQEDVILSREPLECYVVLPAQTCSHLVVTVTTGLSEMSEVVGSATFNPSELHELRTLEYVDQTPISWALVGQYDWNGDGEMDWSSDIAMTKEGDNWVLKGQYLEANSGFKFRRNADWNVNLGGCSEGDLEDVHPGSETSLLSYGCNLSVAESGYYDIYLNTTRELLCIMQVVK